MKKLCYIIAGLLMLASCSNDGPEENTRREPHKIVLSEQQNIQKENANRFAFKVWDSLSENREDANMAFSPLSLYQCLSMLANGAEGESLSQIRQLLGATDNSSIAEINDFNKFLFSELPKVDPAVKLSLANAVWAKSGIEIFPEFSALCNDYFNAKVFAGADADKMTYDINRWCAEKTNGMITNFLDNGEQADNVNILSANYFESPWAVPVDKSLTEPMTFHNLSGTTPSVPMMKLACGGYLTDKALVITIGYANLGYRMTVFFPHEGVSLKEAMTDEVLGAINSGNYTDYKQVELRMPKFTTDFDSRNMLDILKACGFTATGQFTLITPATSQLSTVRQKIRVEVSEEGTKAASVSDAGLGVTAPMPEVPMTIVLDRPFGYTISEVSTGAILFMGRVTEL